MHCPIIIIISFRHSAAAAVETATHITAILIDSNIILIDGVRATYNTWYAAYIREYSHTIITHTHAFIGYNMYSVCVNVRVHCSWYKTVYIIIIIIILYTIEDDKKMAH